MSLGRNQLSNISSTASLRTVRSAIPIELGDVVATDRATLIMGDVITVSGKVNTGGNNLRIFCRKLFFATDASISTNGSKGVPDFLPEQRRENDRQPGADGIDGADGGQGSPAGDVSIAAYLIEGCAAIEAKGGDGGRGQDGGNASNGADGRPGEKREESDNDKTYPSKANGAPGMDGGKCGLPGRAGRAGDGGKVTVSSVNENTNTPRFDVSCGAPPAVANPGRPGIKGLGGAPGYWHYKFNCQADDGGRGHLGIMSVEGLNSDLQLFHMTEKFGATDLTAHIRHVSSLFSLTATPLRISCEIGRSEGMRGKDGNDGSDRQQEVMLKQQITLATNGIFRGEAITVTALGEKFDSSYLDFLVCDIENQFRVEGLSPTSLLLDRIKFLIDITEEDSGKREFLGRGYSMARKINLGLDFYGFSLESAPLMSFDTYKNIVERTLAPLAKIEESFFRYWDDTQTNDARRAAAGDAFGKCREQQFGLEVELERVSIFARQTLKELPAQDARVELSFGRLKEAESALNAAILKNNIDCKLTNVLIAAATIVAGVASGGAGFVAAASAGAKLYSDATTAGPSVSDLWDSRSELQDDLKEIGEGASSVAQGISAIQTAIAGLNTRPKLPKFRMERARFEEIAEQFSDIAESVNYKEAGLDYLKAIETRNQSILDYNASLAQYVDIQSRKAAAVRAATVLGTIYSGSFDPSSGPIVAMMSRLYLDSLNLAAQMVHTEKKALAYHFGVPSDPSVSALNGATITAAHLKIILNDWVAAKERFLNRRELYDGQLVFDIEKLIGFSSWKDFKEHGVVAFTIRRNHPLYKGVLSVLPGLRVTGVQITLEGATVRSGLQVPWYLCHGGFEKIYDGSGISVDFSHRLIRFSGTTDPGGGLAILKPDFSENDLYAGVSPYASWLLTVVREDSTEIDLSQLRKAQLKFSGYMIQS